MQEPLDVETEARESPLMGSGDRTEDARLRDARVEIARLRAALAAREDAKFLEAIVENIPHMIFVKDAAELRFVRLNRAGERLLGYSSADLLGKNDYDFFPEEEARAFTEKDREALVRRQLAEVTEEPIHTRHGTRYLHTLKVPIVDETGKAAFLLGISEDITEQKLAREEARAARLAAEEANRAKSEFLAFMSHELRTPLNGVLGMARLLEGTSLDESQREMVRGIVVSGERLLKIASDLLDLTRVEAGKLAVETHSFDVAEATRDVLGLFSERAASRGIDIHVEVAPSVPRRVVGDAIRVQQVLTNLVGNALRFTDDGHVIVRVRVVREGASGVTLRFDVEDTGVGIGEEHLPRLFDRFFEAGAGGASARGGTGLGLLLSKRIVELLGGTIGVTSRPGFGSTFSFEIPFGIGAATESAPPAAVGALPPLRVLVVEDDPVGARVVELMLRRLGLHVEWTADGRDAAERAARNTFDVVLMDINLPGANGFEASRAIRDRLGDDAPPIVALTADASSALREECRKGGMIESLSKPVSLEELHRVLARVAVD